MICVKPEIKSEVICPRCSQTPVTKEIMIQPIVSLAEFACRNCGFEFLRTLSVGHTINDALTLSKSNGKLYPGNSKQTWLSEALLKAYANEKSEPVQINRIVFKNYDQVVVLNTLDFLYGHVLLKLYNAIYHLDNHKNLGLIIIIPKLFEWLIPKGCAEAWIVDLKLNEMIYFYSSIQKFASKEFERFETIYFSKAYSHPDIKEIDISRMTGVRPFDLTEFIRLRPTFTFVLRQDRWWMPGLIDYWFYRICRKLKVLKVGSRLLSKRQNSLVKKTIILVRKELPNAKFHIVGLGTTGSFKGYASDHRNDFIDSSIEKKWCDIYGGSHVVIGAHGSNMLLPTAHAAGCVEILPEDRYGNIAQDISVRHADRKQLYFYRFADQYSCPKLVANKVIAIIKNFEIFEKNMCRNVYSSRHELTKLAQRFTMPSVDDARR